MGVRHQKAKPFDGPKVVNSRESVSQKSPSKRHVFSKIYLLFNRKRSKNPCIIRPPFHGRSSLCLIHRSKRHVFSKIYLLFNRKRSKNPCIIRDPSRDLMEERRNLSFFLCPTFFLSLTSIIHIFESKQKAPCALCALLRPTFDRPNILDSNPSMNDLAPGCRPFYS